jgi:hypothetical protein
VGDFMGERLEREREGEERGGEKGKRQSAHCGCVCDAMRFTAGWPWQDTWRGADLYLYVCVYISSYS